MGRGDAGTTRLVFDPTPPPPPLRKTGSWMIAGGHMRHLTVYRRLFVAVFVAGLYGGLVEVLERHYLKTDLKVTAVQSVLGLVFGALLVFRTNAAYARWWEGRTLWGSLVNSSRNLMVKVTQLVALPRDEKVRFAELVVGFAYALRNRLRGDDVLQHVPGFAHDPAHPSHVPVDLVNRMYAHMARWRRADLIDTQMLVILNGNANALLDVCGGCERISRTPMVPSYVLYVRICIGLYLLVLPWTLELGLMLAPLTMIWAYFLCGMELIAEIIEDPFGTERDDLQLDALCDGISATVHEIANAAEPA